MIERALAEYIKKSALQLPVIAILGPRQSGKTTLAKMLFNNHVYVSLENLDTRMFAQSDPRRFLQTYKNEHGIIIDEVQRVPDLLSYIQTYVDEEKQNGYFVLTGSENFLLSQVISQSLAGRISINTLLPLSIDELKTAQVLPADVQSALFNGMYPRIYADKVDPVSWYADYITTYVERDVRQIISVVDLGQFQRFLKLCVGRIGQLLNMSSLANDCGISVSVAQSWISLLQASYIIFLLQPHHNNFSKRLIKSPKLYFYDTGLACSLLQLESPSQLDTHYLRGGLFESCIISDLIKQRFNSGKRPNIYFWRDVQGHEVDCLIERGADQIPVEIKAGSTITQSYFDGIAYFSKLANRNCADGYVIYGGDENQIRSAGKVLGWQSVNMLSE